MKPRLVAIVGASAVVAAGAILLWRPYVDATPSSSETECPAGAAQTTDVPRRLTDDERAEVVRIVERDPIVSGLTGTTTLTEATGRASTGYQFVPKAFLLHGPQVGEVVLVTVRLATPVPRGLRQWRTFGAQLRDNCSPNTTVSAWTQLQAQTVSSDLKELYVEVSLRHKRAITVTAIPGDGLRPIGKREYLVP